MERTEAAVESMSLLGSGNSNNRGDEPQLSWYAGRRYYLAHKNNSFELIYSFYEIKSCEGSFSNVAAYFEGLFLLLLVFVTTFEADRTNL